MDIDEFLEFIDYKITDGSPYMWDCFGKNARCVSYEEEDNCNFTVSAIFDTKTKFVYNLEVCDYNTRICYRWISSTYKDAYYSEAKQRGVDPNQAYDDVDFIDYTLPGRWTIEALKIMEGIALKEEPVEMKDLLESTLLDFYRNYLDLSSNDNITIQIRKYIEGKYREI